VRAIQVLEAPQASLPDLIFVDIEMPKMGGYAVIQHLRSQVAFKQIPFVIISRHSGLIDILKGKLVGASAHILKPFTADTVCSVVESYLGVAIPRWIYLKERNAMSGAHDDNQGQGSVVVRLLQRIRDEYESAKLGLTGLAYGTSQHQVITSKME
jgi:CheY-like chemotaxis protein